MKIKTDNLIKDIFAGIVVALVSIPISMGYAQIAGLPVIYGLYGSIIPIFLYAILTTSRQFVVGVDAMPAAMIGGLLAEMGILGESAEALKLVPVMSLLVSVWFLVFYFLQAGRIVKYISTPVMGGFISGVGVTIILMQVPKLFGGTPGTGEVFELLANIVSEIDNFNLVAFVLGISTIVIILLSKKIIPKIPMTVVLLFLGGVLQAFISFDKFGVKLLPNVASGLPRLIIPDIRILADASISDHIPAIILQSMSIAAVIMAQTLLATGKYAMKNGFKVDNGRELLAFSAMNAGSSVIGCCPINGSVSRSGIADSLGARSQWMSISSAISMLIILLVGTPLFKYLPVPVLTGIVMTALIGIIDFKMIKRLWHESKNELIIFFLSFLGVLVFGTVYGVIIGCVLSFFQVAMESVVPPVAFEGRIPGHGNFYSLSRNSLARPIKNTIIYRFSGNLFFANIDKFVADIEGAIKEDTHQIVIDARGISDIDITATDKLIGLYEEYQKRGIKFYITEHEGSLNDLIRKQGGAKLIEEGVVRRTITLALRDAGLRPPYELEESYSVENNSPIMESDERLAEFEWAFGEDASEYMEKLAEETAEEMATSIHNHVDEIEDIDEHGFRTHWGILGRFDENEFWDHLEVRIHELYEHGRISEEEMEALEIRIEKRRESGEHRLEELNPHAKELLDKRRMKVLAHLKEKDPEEYEHLMELYKRIKHKNN